MTAEQNTCPTTNRHRVVSVPFLPLCESFEVISLLEDKTDPLAEELQLQKTAEVQGAVMRGLVI